jgi:protein-S-isoprenylcysteine O-methyltransferase Ste14
VADVKLGNGPRAAHAAGDGIPEDIAANSKRRYDADSRDCDTWSCPHDSYNSGVRTFAWAGAALFVVSLAFFAWRYFGPFGEVAAGLDVLRPLTINLLLFSVFALHHSLLARTGAKAVVTRAVPPQLERATYVWVASLMFIAVCALWQPVPGLFWHASGAAAGTLRALSLIGAWLTLQSAAMLDMFELAGTRPLMKPQPDSELKAHGPYALVRHPIYLAWLFLVWTPTAMTGTRLAFAAISTAYLVVAIPFEERSLRATLGPKYDAYAMRVRWRLVPGIY